MGHVDVGVALYPTEHGVRLREELVFDFPDHKGWDLFIGQRSEGAVSWWGETHELVRDQTIERVGFTWSGHYDNSGMHSDNVFDTFDEALRDFKKAVFPNG